MSGPSRWVAQFDSATAMVRALAATLREEPFEHLGVRQPLAPLAPVVNALPAKARDQLYAWSGWGEAIPPRELRRVRSEAISEWTVNHYGGGPFPAAFVGSSNGAGVHLAAALGAPWLPQTFLLPVRRHGVSPDDPKADMAWGWEPGRELLRGNPDLQLHHMHDPNQDRLMIQHMTYFRVKKRRLGDAYARFLTRSLPDGAPLFVVECTKRWPVVRLGPRHVFQFGAVGGITAEEYLHGSSRVAEYLQRYDVPRLKWDPPEPDDEVPEAEWGFEPSLRDDVMELARKNDWPVRRLVFEDPMDVSPLVADLYRWWHELRGMVARRLLVESFMLQAPWQALRSGSVPYWMTFNSEQDANRLEAFLEERAGWDEIALMLMNHGTESAGMAPAARWRQILERARYVGRFLGVDPDTYPRDLATYVRYSKAAARLPALDGGRPPDPLTVAELDAFLEEHGDRYAVNWITEPLEE